MEHLTMKPLRAFSVRSRNKLFSRSILSVGIFIFGTGLTKNETGYGHLRHTVITGPRAEGGRNLEISRKAYANPNPNPHPHPQPNPNPNPCLTLPKSFTFALTFEPSSFCQCLVSA